MKRVCVACGEEILPKDYIVCGDYICDDNMYEYCLHMTDECLLDFMRGQFLESTCTFEGEASRFMEFDE